MWSSKFDDFSQQFIWHWLHSGGNLFLEKNQTQALALTTQASDYEYVAGTDCDEFGDLHPHVRHLSDRIPTNALGRSFQARITAVQHFRLPGASHRTGLLHSKPSHVRPHAKMAPLETLQSGRVPNI